MDTTHKKIIEKSQRKQEVKAGRLSCELHASLSFVRDEDGHGNNT